MPAYNFIAINTQSKEQKGVIEADSEKHARQLLRDKTLIPIRVSATTVKKAAGKTKQSSLFGKKKLTAREVALITRQIATLLSAGMPVEECLLAVSEQSEKQNVKSLLLSVR